MNSRPRIGKKRTSRPRLRRRKGSSAATAAASQCSRPVAASAASATIKAKVAKVMTRVPFLTGALSHSSRNSTTKAVAAIRPSINGIMRQMGLIRGCLGYHVGQAISCGAA